MSVPFTYLVTHLPSGRLYYGARWAKNCHPNDLWTSYFTSSKTVKELLEKDGIDAFACETRKIFSSKKECQDWEKKVLRRLDVLNSNQWLNEGIGAPPGFRGDEEHRLKLSLAQRGKSHSEETKLKMAEMRRGVSSGMKGKIHSEDTKRRISETQMGRKRGPYKKRVA